MKKLNVILICIIVALIFGIVGYIIGINMRYIPKNSSLSNVNIEEKIVGTYYCTTWNGHEAVLTLYKDGTCDYPTGNNGTWTVEKNTIHIDIDFSSALNEFYNKVGEEKSLTSAKDRHDAIIVDNGIILHDKFFQKMN